MNVGEELNRDIMSSAYIETPQGTITSQGGVSGLHSQLSHNHSE